MNNKIKAITTALALSAVLAGCATVNVNINPKGSGSDNKPSIANPWLSISEEEASSYPRMFKAPDNAENIRWSMLDPTDDLKSADDGLVDLDFDITDEYRTLSFKARYMYGASEDTDISGLYYDWTVTDEGTMANWGGGQMPVRLFRYIGDDETVDLITWYDIEIGIAYCLSVKAPDLDGFDIQAVAESMYPDDYVDFGDGPTDFLQYQSGVTDFDSYDDVISYLEEGQGYAYINVYGWDNEMLAVSELVFEADHTSADMSLYKMEDGKPVQVANVTGNGSAYPIRLADGIIYTGDNHTYETWFMGPYGGLMMKDCIDDGTNDGSGEFTGFMRDDNNFDNDREFTGGQEEFDELISRREEIPAIKFNVIGLGEEDTEYEQVIDISGCDTLTDIVDKKIPAGMAYTNAPIGADGALLVASGAYDDLEGHMAAIDAEVYIYIDGVPAYIGYVMSAGTATPLVAADGYLYTASHHSVNKYGITDGRLELAETAGEVFDSDGNVTYYCGTGEAGNTEDSDQDKAQQIYERLWDEYFDADILNFDVIK